MLFVKRCTQCCVELFDSVKTDSCLKYGKQTSRALLKGFNESVIPLVVVIES